MNEKSFIKLFMRICPKKFSNQTKKRWQICLTSNTVPKIQEDRDRQVVTVNVKS